MMALSILATKSCIPTRDFLATLDYLGFGGIPVPFVLSRKNRLQPDPDEIARKITQRTKILITNSPGNPTGTVYTEEVQRQLAELAVKHDLTFFPMKFTLALFMAGTMYRC